MALLGCECRRQRWRRGGGSIEINTTHEHYTDFEIDGVAFRCYGDLVFKDGDKVRLYAYKSDKGYYQIVLIKNFTRDFYVGPKPQKPTQDDDKDNDKNQKKSVFQIIGTIIVAMMMGIFYGFLPALVISFVVTVIGVIFFDVDNIEFIDKLGLFLGMDRFFDLLFMAVVFLAIIGGFAIICAIGAIISLLPESESAKQARKQR